MEYRTRPSPLLSAPNVLNMFCKGSALAALVAFGAVPGCGALEDGSAPSAATETRTGAMVNITPGQAEFKYLSPIAPLSTGTGDPAFCATPDFTHSKIMFTRDTSGYIQGNADDIGVYGPWGKYGGAASLRKFGGRPACALLNVTSNPHPFILLARGATAPDGSSDKRLYWSKGNWTYNPPTSSPPAVQTQWAAIDGTQYSTNGNPAIATHSSELVVVYLKDNGQIAGNAWNGTTFTATVNGPTLPANWAGLGTPTIAFAPSWAQKYVIFVRARNSMTGQIRFYETFFSNGHFTGAAGGPAPGSYQTVTLPAGAPSLDSDPAYEYNDGDAFHSGTLYYRSGTQIYQVSASNSVDQFDSSTIRAILSGSAPAITGNPVAIGGVIYEGGTHWVLARGAGNNLYFGESVADEQLAPN